MNEGTPLTSSWQTLRDSLGHAGRICVTRGTPGYTVLSRVSTCKWVLTTLTCDGLGPSLVALFLLVLSSFPVYLCSPTCKRIAVDPIGEPLGHEVSALTHTHRDQ